jgi:hypothetical protein
MTSIRAVDISARFAGCVECSLTVSAQQGNAHLERVLVPISVGSVPGAYGTVWSTELGTEQLDRERHDLASQLRMVSGDQTNRTSANRQLSGKRQARSSSLEGTRRQNQFDSDLQLCKPEGSWGTKIPVVREHEFRSTANIINVPTAPDFRSALRIYALPADEDPPEVVRVRIYSHYEDLLVDTELTLREWPPYAGILSLTDTFPEIRQEDRVRIEVDAVNPAAKIWAFVSVTSNHTQNVSIVTPN